MPRIGITGRRSAEFELRAAVARFQAPRLAAGLWQIGSSLTAFLAVCMAMYVTFGWSYALTLALSVVAAGLVVRIFVIQHDCGHGSFFSSRRANDAVGRLCSLITLTPYANWRRQHAGHHAVWNDLDRRWSGADIYSTCLTVAEYRTLTPWKRLCHRVTRHPLVTILILPPLIFLLLYRVPFDTPKSWRRERADVYLTDIAIAALILGLGLLVGFQRVLLVQAPIMVIASICGVWLFAVQHRFEGVQWQQHGQWSFEAASLRGSSYLRLPPVLRWFTANIGFHHIHHLNPHVPNYRLAACHAALPALQGATTLTLRDGLRALSFVLWDESRRAMITFRMAGSATG
jgi:acyl-lipid omega-6 desaturase (Delta-12 desaturase)